MPLLALLELFFSEVRVTAWRHIDIEATTVSGCDSGGSISWHVTVFIEIFPLKPASFQGNMQGLTF